MPSKIRQLGDFAKQADTIIENINIDSSRITTIAQGAGVDSSTFLGLIDSDYLSTRQNFSFASLSDKPTTLGGYGITNAKTSAQQDSDITATIGTVRDGVATELNNLNKMAAAINDDADFFNAVKSYTFENAAKSTTQGINHGYTSGGANFAITNFDIIDRFPFAVDANATDVGDLTVGRYRASGHSSLTHGYTAGGDQNPGSDQNVIDKFSFSSSANATDVGDLLSVLTNHTGHQSGSSGYVSAGNDGTASPFLVGIKKDIQKFPFTSDGNSTRVGDLTETKLYSQGLSSTHCGFVAGGDQKSTPPFTPYEGGVSNKIERFPFAADTNSTDIGDLTTARKTGAGNSSETHGYVSGGATFVPASHPTFPSSGDFSIVTIEKFPFASTATSTSVGDLAEISYVSGMAAQNSNVSGYVTLGNSAGYAKDIGKFSFASDGDGTVVGDLSVTRNFLGPTGQQN